MKKFAYMLLAIGAVLILIGLILNPGPPYQDPTPEMLAKERSEESRCFRFLAAGAITFSTGLLTVLILALRPKNK